MCGITALFDPAADAPALMRLAGAMTDAIAHRGPDGSGLWRDDNLPLVLGHRRLSIIDLTSDGAQPMLSASGRYAVAYNGEIYNFRELRAELEAAGHVFKGRSDTEVMLAAIDRFGLNRACQRISGMYAIILWDREKRELHLVRDRIGKKPLYVGWAGRALAVSSELKSFHAHPQFVRAVRRSAVASLALYACVPSPQSIFENVFTLMPGCRMTLSPEHLMPGCDLSALMEPYWNPGQAVDAARARMPSMAAMPDADRIAAFDDVLTACVSDRMISDVPLGAFLSGGIDSSVVVALMQKLSDRPVKTYSIGFAEDAHDESRYAREVAAHLGTDHHEHILTAADAQAIIPKLPDMYDEPFADASEIPTYLVSAFARRDVTVALSGDGGDEMLGGYRRHAFAQKYWGTLGRVPHPLRAAAAGIIQSVPTGVYDTLLPFRANAGQLAHKAAGVLRQRDPLSLYAFFLGFWNNPSDILHMDATGYNRLNDPKWWPSAGDLSVAETMMLGDTLLYLPDEIMVKVDRASMAVALEARAPLLDSRVFDFAWSLPRASKFRNGEGKWILREVLARYLPRPLFERPKRGFYLPVGEWLRGPLKEWAGDLLNDRTLHEDGFFKPAAVRAAFDDHCAGRASLEPKLWIILMYQAWRLRWLSGSMDGKGQASWSLSASNSSPQNPARTATNF